MLLNNIFKKFEPHDNYGTFLVRALWFCCSTFWPQNRSASYLWRGHVNFGLFKRVIKYTNS